MRRLLIHPPFSDPTQPYLSLPTLKAYLKGRRLDAQVVDLNVEATHWLLQRDTIEELARSLGLRFLKLNAAAELSFDEQREYRQIALARPKIETVLGAEVSPAVVFRDNERFHDPAQYCLARREVELLFEALSAAHYPYRFHFNHAAHQSVPWSFDLLDRYCTDSSSPFAPFYERVFDTQGPWTEPEDERFLVSLEEVDFIGLSIVFPSQIPEAMFLARFLKSRAPRAFVAFGGPCIHQISIHLEEERRRRLFEFVDGISLFEGEETLVQLFPLLEQWHARADAVDRAALLRNVPNLMIFDPSSRKSRQGPRFTLDLGDGAPPDYGDLDLDRYFAPSRTLLYAPTRGCYWGQCSFCYYGLAEVATASYREIAPERAAAELARLSQRHGVRNFYLSCDVLSPSYALRLAQALVDKDLRIRWSCDLKIEKYFTEERCRLLYQSGLRAAAFGIESGSDRILERMRKGCDRETMTRVNRLFHRAGIATEWMTFTDHPDETVEEALETVHWIKEEIDFIDLFIVGEFGLERGSHIAQDPARYGVEKIFYADGDELGLYALFTQKMPPRTQQENERVDRVIDEVARTYAQKPYPWAGANSTHHSFLHFLRFGQSAFKTHFQRAHKEMYGELPPPPPSHLQGLKERARFSLERIERNERRFFEQYYPRALYTTLPGRRGGVTNEVAALSLEHYQRHAATLRPLRPGR